MRRRSALLCFGLLAGTALAQPSPDGAKRLRDVAAAPITDAMLREPTPPIG